MSSFKDMKSAKLEKAAAEAIAQELNRMAEPEIENEDELFVLAEYDEMAAEMGGYSNYSYWRSTLQVFFKNKVAVFLLFVLAALLLFTFIQPYLPGQYPANLINNNPQTGKQLSNLSPSLTTVLVTAPEGTTLVAAPVKNAEGWYAVHNVADSIKSRTKFNIVEYGEDWCKVELKGKTGYVKNNFQTKLKLPEDPTAVPYESRSNFKIEMFTSPEDYTNNGTALYVQADSLTLNEDGTARFGQPENEGMGNPMWDAVWVDNGDGTFTTAECVGEGPQIAGFWENNSIVGQLLNEGMTVPVKADDYADHVAKYGIPEAGAAPAGEAIAAGVYTYMEPTPFGDILWTVTINEDGTAIVSQPENEGMGNPTWTATVINNPDGTFTTADCVGDGPQIAAFWKDNGITWINNGDGTVTPVE